MTSLTGMANLNRPDNNGPETSKDKKGFSIGPANLPDGVHKRKGNCTNNPSGRLMMTNPQYKK